MAASVLDFQCTDFHTYVDVCDYTWGLYGCHKRVCTGSLLWEKNPLLHLYCAWRFSQMPYQLSHSRPLKMCV